MQNQKIKVYIRTFCILLAFVFIYGCNNNTEDEIILKELKQQTVFLEEQYQRSELAFEDRINSQYHGILYYPLFKAHDSLVKITLSSFTDGNLCEVFETYIRKSNLLFADSQKSDRTRFLEDDRPLLYIKNDSICQRDINIQLKKELLTQQILKHAITIVNLCRDCIGTCSDYFWLPSHIGYRLTIHENSKSEVLLYLKYLEPRKLPFPSHLEFNSLEWVYVKGNYDYDTKKLNIKSNIIETSTKNEGIFIKTKPLKPGLYRINTYNLSISESGKLIKDKVEFDFEITESQ